jgi:hypothetical protein
MVPCHPDSHIYRYDQPYPQKHIGCHCLCCSMKATSKMGNLKERELIASPMVSAPFDDCFGEPYLLLMDGKNDTCS